MGPDSHNDMTTVLTLIAFVVGLTLAVGIPVVALFSQYREEVRESLPGAGGAGPASPAAAASRPLVPAAL